MPRLCHGDFLLKPKYCLHLQGRKEKKVTNKDEVNDKQSDKFIDVSEQ
jgi:hypothetical protein